MNPFTIISNLRNSSSITINGKVVNSNIISDGCNITIDGNGGYMELYGKKTTEITVPWYDVNDIFRYKSDAV